MVSPAERQWISAVPSPKVQRHESPHRQPAEPSSKSRPESLKLKQPSFEDDQSSESTSSSSPPTTKHHESLRLSTSSPLGSPLLTRLKNSPTIRALRATLSGNYSQKLQSQNTVKGQFAAISSKSEDFSAVNVFTRIFEISYTKDAFKKMCAQEGMSSTFEFIEDYCSLKASEKAKPNDNNVAVQAEQTLNKYPEFKEATQNLNFASHTYTDDVLHQFEESLTQIGATLKEKFKNG